MYDIEKASTQTNGFTAIQNPTAARIAKDGRVVAVLVSPHGSVCIVEDQESGDLYGLVNGMRTEGAREFLSKAGHISDILDELLVCDRPDAYPLDEAPERRFHVRRDA